MVDSKELYSFSDDFLNFIQMAAKQDPTIQSSEEETPEEDATPDEEDDRDYDALQKQYTDLQAEHERVLDEAKRNRTSTNSLIQNDEFLNASYNGVGNLSVINRVLQDEYGAGDIPVKSDRVNLQDVDMTLTGYVNSLRHKFGDKILATSGNDQYDEHAANSLHKKGEALDLRYHPDLYNYIANDPVAQQLGLSVLPPNHGTAPHIHLQKKQYGGLPQYPDGGKVKGKVPTQEDIKPTYQSTLLPNQSYIAPAAPPNQLPPVTVVGHKDKDTADFYNLVKGGDFPTYQALIEMGQKYGFMKINPSVRDKFKDGSDRASYNGMTNTAYIGSGTGELKVDNFLSELPHMIQRRRGFFSMGIQDMPTMFVPADDTYNIPGTVEYEAHTQMEPQLRNEFRDLKNDVITTDPYSLKLLNADNRWAPDIEEMRKKGKAYDELRRGFGDPNMVSSYTYKYGGKYKVK